MSPELQTAETQGNQGLWHHSITKLAMGPEPRSPAIWFVFRQRASHFPHTQL